MRYLLVLLFLLPSMSWANQWKGLVIAGSKDQHVFDNARMSIVHLLQEKGMPVRSLTSDSNFTMLDPEVEAATPMNIIKAFNLMRRASWHRCFIYITSHGVQRQGVMMNGKLASVRILDSYIYRACRGAPSVIVVSACYSGVFLHESFARADRIIMTASRHDRPSFGCTNDEIYTYYDSCFIANFSESYGSWRHLHRKVRKCVRAKEKELNAERKKRGLPRFLYSDPQFFVGEDLEDY